MVASISTTEQYNVFVDALKNKQFGFLINVCNSFELGEDATHLLELICQSGNEELVDIFIKCHLKDINKKDSYGMTPLMYGVQDRDVKVVKTLLQYGASVNIKSNSGMTALDMTIDKDIFKILTEQKSNILL